MTVIRSPSGTFDVVDADCIIATSFATEAAAWRWIDRQTMEPISPAERTVDWRWKDSLGDRS